MPAVPAGFTVAWPGSSAVPTGWERATELDERFPKGAVAGADPGVPGGAETHTHTSPAHTHTIGSHAHNGGDSGSSSGNNVGNLGPVLTVAANVHHHILGETGFATGALTATAASFGSSPNDPPYRTVRWIRSLGTATGIPVGGWCYWDTAVLPSGWSAPAAARSKYLRGAAAGADGGGTGGSSSGHSHAGTSHQHGIGAHTHSNPVQTGATPTAQMASASTVPMASSGHTHNVTVSPTPSVSNSGAATSPTSGTATAEPPYVVLGTIQNDNAVPDMPIGTIGLWLGLLTSIPLSLTACDGLNGTVDTRGKYIKGAELSGADFTGIGTTGGAATHDHTDPASHFHTDAHAHTISFSATTESTNAPGGSSGGISATHSHGSITSGLSPNAGGSTVATIDAGSNEPLHRTVVWVKFTGAIDITITAPAAETELASPSFTATWTLSEGTQATKRVRIYASDQATVVYDSGLIASTDQEYDIPSGIGLRTGRTYYLQVSAVNDAGLPGDSTLLPFTTSWVPPEPVTGLTLTPVGSTDGRLPGIRADWTAYAGADTFVSYGVHRRELRTLLDEHEPLVMQIEDDGRVLLPTADVLNGVQGAIAFRVTTPATGSGTPTYFDWQDDSTHRFRLLYDVSAGEWQFWRLTDGGTTTLSVTRALAAETLTIVAAWDASTLYLSFSGAAYTSAASVAGQELTVDLADIGSRQGFDDAGADFLWLLTFADVPAAAALAVIHALGDDPPYIAALEDIAAARPVALWDAEQPAGSKVAPDDWTDIATIEDVALNYYVDYRPDSGRSYEYAVTVTASVFGDPISSDRQDPAPHESVTWRGIALHEPDDPTRFLILRGRELQVEPEQDKAYVQARGRRQRTAQYGERRDRKIALTPIPHLITEPREWEQLERFLARQQDEARTYLVRPGHRPEGWYVQLDDLSRRDVLVLGQSDVVFQQVHYDESAS